MLRVIAYQQLAQSKQFCPKSRTQASFTAIAGQQDVKYRESTAWRRDPGR